MNVLRKTGKRNFAKSYQVSEIQSIKKSAGWSKTFDKQYCIYVKYWGNQKQRNFLIG